MDEQAWAFVVCGVCLKEAQKKKKKSWLMDERMLLAQGPDP